jgi:hypothetical protein
MFLKLNGKSDTDVYKKISKAKERVEFVFVILMAILLIFLFNPRHDRSIQIDNETKILLYLFGFILLLTAKWDTFIEEAPWFKKVQEIIGKNN